MPDNNEKINLLLEKLETLLKRQENFWVEIVQLREEINNLKSEQSKSMVTDVNNDLYSVQDIKIEHKPKPENISIAIPQEKKHVNQVPPALPNYSPQPQAGLNLEKFIGENLISKIGIVITVIGVAIGAKYSIEHHLISPLTRIILGYLIGVALLLVGIKLKKNYETYSAVLVSGAMAIFYFITYAAYAFYGLIPQTMSFALMVVFTAFTVVAAISYNQQVIAHIGLVGAYAVPFLLSDGSGKVVVMFIYMVIINIGILVIAFKKYWKTLYYSAFTMTWLIFFSWAGSKYDPSVNFDIALTFLFIFFAIFYAVFLAYKLVQKEQFELGDIILLLLNSFIFYGGGYAILNSHLIGAQYLGLFTVGNALVHFIVSAIIYRQKLGDKNLFYFVAGLVLVFITIAIPVQLDGHWVTLLWAFEAALLFWIGRTKNVTVYEKLSYVLMFIAFASLSQDWLLLYGYDPLSKETRLTPLLNINFLSSALFIVAFTFINTINYGKQTLSPGATQTSLRTMMNYVMPVILILSVYFAFRMELTHYWQQLNIDSAIEIKSTELGNETIWNYDLENFQKIWEINYSLLFLSILAFINIKKIKNPNLGTCALIFIAFFMLVFLYNGLITLNELRNSYLNPELHKYFQHGSFNIGIRYVSFAFVAFALMACYSSVKQKLWIKDLSIHFDCLLHVTVLWISSNELINWMDISAAVQSDKLGLTILWGLYALFLITLGIWKKKKHLRIGAIALFTVTLLKLFFYDLIDLNTIAKTIVFVSLGILLLIISFLYHKYKHLIADENEK